MAGGQEGSHRFGFRQSGQGAFIVQCWLDVVQHLPRELVEIARAHALGCVRAGSLEIVPRCAV